MFFSFSAKAKQGALFCEFPRELERGRVKSPRSDRVAINTGREQLFSVCILHKHKPASSETANERVTRGLELLSLTGAELCIGGRGGGGEDDRTSELLRWVLEALGGERGFHSLTCSWSGHGAPLSGRWPGLHSVAGIKPSQSPRPPTLPGCVPSRLLLQAPEVQGERCEPVPMPTPPRSHAKVTLTGLSAPWTAPGSAP